MIYIYIILVLAVLGLIYMRIEASLVQVKRVKFTKSKNCLRILQLSDIHINFLRVSPKKVRDIISKENPDLILMTGDYFDKYSHIKYFMCFLNYIRCGYRTYLILGNHDFNAFIRNKRTDSVDTGLLQEFIDNIYGTDISVLHNQSICFEKNSKKYNIIGISDMKYDMHDIEKAFSSVCTDAFMNITISHNPDIALEIPRGNTDYLFCGHFHGGQIWAPFNIEFKFMRKEKLCKMGIRRGLHKLRGINLYINRGLGNVCFPLRFLSRPEITVFYLP